MKSFCDFLLISSFCFYFYENFACKINLFSINSFFYYEFVYSVCSILFILYAFLFLSVYFWFSSMAYNVYHTYMDDQQCWGSLPGHTFFYKQHFFSTQTQCCLRFSWTQLQMLLRCCLIHISIIILRCFISLLCLCPYLNLSLFMPYLRESIFIFVFIFSVINYIISWIQTCFFFCFFL